MATLDAYLIATARCEAKGALKLIALRRSADTYTLECSFDSYRLNLILTPGEIHILREGLRAFQDFPELNEFPLRRAGEIRLTEPKGN